MSATLSLAVSDKPESSPCAWHVGVGMSLHLLPTANARFSVETERDVDDFGGGRRARRFDEPRNIFQLVVAQRPRAGRSNLTLNFSFSGWLKDCRRWISVRAAGEQARQDHRSGQGERTARRQSLRLPALFRRPHLRQPRAHVLGHDLHPVAYLGALRTALRGCLR